MSTDIKVQVFQSELQSQSDAIDSLVISDNPSFVTAGNIVNALKGIEKRVKAHKEETVKPLYDAYVEARDRYKPLETGLKSASDIIKKKMLEYKQETARKAAEDEARLQAKIERGTIKRPETILKNAQAINTVTAEEAGMRVTTTKKVSFDITKLPPAYVTELLNRPGVLSALTVEIRKDALGNKAQGIEPRIEDGVTVTEEESLTV